METLKTVEEKTLPEGYRMTELGPLPEDWRVVRLGEVFDIQQGKALSRKKDKGIRPRPFLRTANVLWGKIDLKNLDKMDFFPEEEKKYALQPGDLLVCEGGEIGRTAIWEGQLSGVYYQNHLHRLRRKTRKVDPRFYMYWLQTAITLLGLYVGVDNRTTIPNLSRSRLANFTVPLPPLPEQKAIAQVLKSVQEAKEKTEEVIKALKEFKKSLMRHLFTYGPVPVNETDRVEMRETEIRPLPAHWKVVRLGEVANVRYGKAKPKLKGRFPVVGSGGIYDWTSKPLIDFSTLVIGRKGTAGQVWLIEEPCWPSDTTFYLEWKEHADVRFLYEYLLLNPLSGEHAKTTLPSLQRPDLENYLIPLPPLHEQRQIARILQAVDRRIEVEENRKQALEDLFRSLLHNLMTAKIRLPKEFINRFAQSSEE